MGKISKAVRFEILARDGFRCRYCGASAPDVRIDVDHVIPLFRGGTNDPGNLVAACFPCNSGKSDRGLIPKGNEGGFALTPDRRPARLEKIRRAQAAPDPHKHLLDTGEIDDQDELDDDSQLCLVWCLHHRKYEWHYVPLDLIRSGATIERTTRPGWRG